VLAAVSDTTYSILGVAVYAAILVVWIRRSMRRAAENKRLRQVASAAGAGDVVPVHPTIPAPPPSRIDADGASSNPRPIEVVRELLGPVPRKFSREIEAYHAIVKPTWLTKSDPLAAAYKRQKRVRRDGMVVWGVFIQANQLNFKPGPVDVGGSVIYSLDPYYDDNPGDLQNLAAELYLLKGTDQADPETATFARMLTLENSRGMGLIVPKRFTGGRRVLHSSMIFPRKHLPSGFITQNILPVWVDPTGHHGLLPVPAAYWPASLLAYWSRTTASEPSKPAQPTKPAEE